MFFANLRFKRRTSISISQPGRWATLLFACVMTFVSVPGLLAQTDKAGQKSTPPLPVPAQILTGKKVFVSNDAPEIFDDVDSYSGGPNRAYSQFYSGIKTWGRYEIVSAPSDADLILQIHLINLHGRLEGRDIPDQFQLAILDPRTNVLLWKVYREIASSGFQEKRDKNFDKAIQDLINQLAKLAGTR
jgi:hypothetical protein